MNRQDFKEIEDLLEKYYVAEGKASEYEYQASALEDKILERVKNKKLTKRQRSELLDAGIIV